VEHIADLIIYQVHEFAAILQVFRGKSKIEAQKQKCQMALAQEEEKLMKSKAKAGKKRGFFKKLLKKEVNPLVQQEKVNSVNISSTSTTIFSS